MTVLVTTQKPPEEIALLARKYMKPSRITSVSLTQRGREWKPEPSSW